MFARRKYETIAIPLLAAGLFVYASTRHRVQLRPDMPPAFAQASSSEPATSESAASERELARAYWESAMNTVRGYRKDLPLPRLPPPEFRAGVQPPRERDKAEETRQYYWNRLREVWFTESTWIERNEWDFSWMKDPIAATARWFQTQTERVSGSR
jgi:hypothetical protein